MPVKIQATKVRGRDLKPGDLFSVLGPAYWSTFGQGDRVGESVYIRTERPAGEFPDGEEIVFRIEVIKDGASAQGN